MMMKGPVDAVITWVDGNDKAHEEKLAKCLSQMGIHRPEAAAPTRFNQRGEINYCVKSLLCFAPWIRTIFIVTDAQTPLIIKQLSGTPYEEKIKLVDHRDIFCGFENYLPTFNSLSIESVLWRIKGLSDNFIYLNDDCALIRPVTYEDFFCDGKVVLRGSWKIQSEKKWRNHFKKRLEHLLTISPRVEVRNEHRMVQENSARLAGWSKRFFHLPHTPFPINKKTLENFFQKYPESLSQNISYTLRYHQQFWSISLASHLEIKTKNAVVDNTLEAIIVNGACHSPSKIKHQLARADKKNTIAFICMQSIDVASEASQTLLFNWLDKKIRFDF